MRRWSPSDNIMRPRCQYVLFVAVSLVALTPAESASYAALSAGLREIQGFHEVCHHCYLVSSDRHYRLCRHWHMEFASASLERVPTKYANGWAARLLVFLMNSCSAYMLSNYASYATLRLRTFDGLALRNQQRTNIGE